MDKLHSLKGIPIESFKHTEQNGTSRYRLDIFGVG